MVWFACLDGCCQQSRVQQRASTPLLKRSVYQHDSSICAKKSDGDLHGIRLPKLHCLSFAHPSIPHTSYNWSQSLTHTSCTVLAKVYTYFLFFVCTNSCLAALLVLVTLPQLQTYTLWYPSSHWIKPSLFLFNSCDSVGRPAIILLACCNYTVLACLLYLYGGNI